jgi:hypothetical protein
LDWIRVWTRRFDVMHSAMMRKPSARRTGVLPAAVASAGLSVWPDSCAIFCVNFDLLFGNLRCSCGVSSNSLDKENRSSSGRGGISRSLVWPDSCAIRTVRFTVLIVICRVRVV